MQGREGEDGKVKVCSDTQGGKFARIRIQAASVANASTVHET